MERVQEVEAQEEMWSDKVQRGAERVEVLEHDIMEMKAQFEIVTEERDDSRAKEELLFEKLRDKEEENANLTDGYVNITERMTNYMDDISDLQDQVEKYESIMQTMGGTTSAGASTAPQPPSNSDEGKQLAALSQRASIPFLASLG